MPPWSPQEISKRYKRQSLGMPKASPLHQQKASGHFSMRYIFIASCTMCYSWSVFIFCCVCLVFNKNGPHHSFVLERDTLHGFKKVDWCWKSREKFFVSYLMQMEALQTVVFILARRVRCFCELTNYVSVVNGFKQLRVFIVPLKVSCIVSSIESILQW